MTMKLSRRMEALSALVPSGCQLADVGCDHGYLPIFLCQTGRINKALAMDIRKGPLARAEENIKKAGLTAQIKTRLSDGLKELRSGEANAVLLAGMGGHLIVGILSQSSLLEEIQALILQPQSDVALVRRWLRENGYFIVEEDMVLEDGKYYPMLRAERRQNQPSSSETEQLQDAFGPLLLRNKHPVLLDWIEKEFAKTDRLLEQVSNAPAEKEGRKRRIEELAAQKQLLLSARAQF